MSDTSDVLTPDMLPAWHKAAIEALEFPLGWRHGQSDPEKWKSRGKDAFRRLLLENTNPPDPEPCTIRSELRNGYEVRELSVSLGRFRRTTALLAIPSGKGPFPAAILLHDHGAFFDIGKEKMILPFADDPLRPVAEDWAARYYGGQALGDALASRGWVVFAADALGWGSRSCGDYANQQAVACNLLNLGSSWAGVIAAEDMAGARFLAGLPEVDSGRIACMGFSMGAVRSWQLAALSDAVRAAVAVCSFGSIAGLMAPGSNRVRGQSAFAMTHPGLSALMDFPDVAGLAAPKPLYMIHGTEDRLFPEGVVRTACARTKDIYRGFDAEDAFRYDFRPGGHTCGIDDQSRAFSWLDAQFGL